MPLKRFKRQSLFAVSIAALSLSAHPALSSPASDLIDKYNDWYLASGFETAAYEEVIETGDTTEIRNYNVAGVFTITDDDGKPEFSFYADINIPQMIFTGSEVNGDVYSYDSMVVDTANFTFGALDDENTPKDMSAIASMTPLGTLSGTMSDYHVSGYSEKWADHPALSQDMTQEAIFRLLGMTLNQSYGSSSIAKFVSTVKVGEHTLTESTSTGFKTGSIKDGVIEHISVDNYDTKNTLFISAENADKSVSRSTTTSYENVLIKALDLRPILALFKIADAPTPNYIGSYYTENLRLETVVNEAEAYEPFGLLKVSAASTFAKDLAIEGGDGLKLISIFNELKSNPEKKEEALLSELFGAIGDYRLGYGDIKNLEVKSWSPVRAKRINEVDPSFEMSLETTAIHDFSLSSIGRITFENLHGAVEGDDAIFDVGSFELADVAWPELSSLVEKVMLAKSNPQAALDLIPTVGKLSIKNVEANSKDLNSPISLDNFTIEMSDHIGPIPTKISEVISGLRYDAALIPDPMFAGVFERLGIERVEINDSIKIHWDETTQDLSLEELEFELKSGLTVRANLHLGNIPRTVFKNPFEAEAAIALATFKSAEYEILNAPLISELLAVQAEQAGVPAEMLASMLIDGSVQETGPIAQTDFAKELAASTKSFAVNPTSIRVTFNPADPVPLMQLGGMAALAPETLPEMLGAKVDYSE